jgi:hypothetical protein
VDRFLIGGQTFKVLRAIAFIWVTTRAVRVISTIWAIRAKVVVSIIRF